MTYFISFFYKKEIKTSLNHNSIFESGYNNDSFNTSKEIESIEDIQEIEIFLAKKHQCESVTILNYRLI